MISGRVVQLRRYPVKSLLGERTSAADIGETGVAGDRVLALLDRASGRVASAKQPHRWRDLLTRNGSQPCVGAYATVVRSGRVADGDHVTVGP